MGTSLQWHIHWKTHTQNSGYRFLAGTGFWRVQYGYGSRYPVTCALLLLVPVLWVLYLYNHNNPYTAVLITVLYRQRH